VPAGICSRRSVVDPAPHLPAQTWRIMTVPHRSPDTLGLVWYVVIAPVVGAAVASGAFALWLGPEPRGWLADGGTIVSGAAGLLLGGVLGALVPAWLFGASLAGTAPLLRMRVVGTATAMLIVLAIAGLPARAFSTAHIVAFAAAVIACALWVRTGNRIQGGAPPRLRTTDARTTQRRNSRA
jgi:hypothetical protein